MDHFHFQRLIEKLYAVVTELEEMFPGRHFTPDGHMVGSIGECLVADAYDLKLEVASNEGFDATAQDGTRVEIKATQSKRVAFRSCPDHTIIIRINKNGTFEEVFNGPGTVIWAQFSGKPRPTNGQYQIGLKKLAKLASSVPSTKRLSRQNGEVCEK